MACIFYTFRREVRGLTLAQNLGILWGPSTSYGPLMQLASRSPLRPLKFGESVNHANWLFSYDILVKVLIEASNIYDCGSDVALVDSCDSAASGLTACDAVAPESAAGAGVA